MHTVSKLNSQFQKFPSMGTWHYALGQNIIAAEGGMGETIDLMMIRKQIG